MQHVLASRLKHMRHVFVLLLLCAFTAQACFLQAHIHPLEPAATMQPGYAHAPAPADKSDPDDCPLCQAFALAGSFIPPAIILLSLASVVVAAPSASAPSVAPQTRHRHGWQSRAPPRR
jgi:hypothetical protein